MRSSHSGFPQNIRHIKHCSEHPLITVLKLAGSFHKIAKSSSEPLKILISLIDSLRTSVASQSFGQSPEVTLYLYQLWRHIYTSNDVTAIAQSIGTQVWFRGHGFSENNLFSTKPPADTISFINSGFTNMVDLFGLSKKNEEFKPQKYHFPLNNPRQFLYKTILSITFSRL